MLFQSRVFVMLFAAVFFLPGGIVLFVGLRMSRGQREEVHRGHTTGKVEGFKSGHVPIVRYQVMDREFVLPGRAQAGEDITEGMTVDVRYDPEMPERFHLEQEGTEGMSASRFLILFGFAWLLICLLALAVVLPAVPWDVLN